MFFKRSFWLFRISGICLVFAICAGVLMLGENRFGMIRLLSYGLFIHVPAFLFLSALLLYRRNLGQGYHLFTLALLIACVGMYAFFIEPYWIEVKQVDIHSDKITKPLKIALIADFQTYRVGDHEKRAIDIMCSQKPDLILFAGDYIQAGSRKSFKQQVKEVRNLLLDMPCKPKHGIIAVRGNIDPSGWKKMFSGLKVPTIITSGTRTYHIGELAVTTLSWRSSRNTNLVLKKQKGFHIALGHAPDYALGKIPADLSLAGHTHGGQIQIPFIGPLATSSSVPNQWASGETIFEDGRRLFVSHGAGMERGYAPRIRFWCRPQVVIFTLKPAGDIEGKKDVVRKVRLSKKTKS